MARNIAQELSQYLKTSNLCCFIGAGVSRQYTDPITGRIHQGLKSAHGIVNDLSQKIDYIDSTMSFEQACFLVKKNEGRPQLINILKQYINKKNIIPLPAHDLLASMPFTAYLTTNYDCLLEKALDTASQNYSVLIEDADISNWQGYKVPVIKFHGCISRPKTIIAAEDEYGAIDLKLPLIMSLIKVLLSNKTILFLGYSLNDVDFKRIYNELVYILGEYMPRGYAVVKNPTEYEMNYWSGLGLTLIDEDLTSFLQDLKGYAWGNVTTINDKDWTKNSFFSTLSNITSAPSETQAIDAFLRHLYEMSVNTTLSCEVIIKDADKATEQILMQKSNFEAFRKLWDILKPKLYASSLDKNKFQIILNELLEERRNFERMINRRWNEVIQENDNILVYSQSVRLINLLKSVPPNTQRTVNVYICECRPKSPVFFQDALSICKYLEETHFAEFYLIPDVVAGNLMERGKIDKIVMGAHSIYWKNGQPKSFVNTCGTSMLCYMAEKLNIPIYLIAEKEKFIILDNNTMEHVSYQEEENIFEGLNSQTRITPKNIGYDLCEITYSAYQHGIFNIISN